MFLQRPIVRCVFALSAHLSIAVAMWVSVAFSGATAVGQGAAPDDVVDRQRSERYIARLKALQESRVQLRDQTASLVATNPNLQQDLQRALQVSLAAAGSLQVTPPVTATPSLLPTLGAYRGQSGELYLRNELLLWYTFQDNTLIRQQLMLSLVNSQRSAAQTYATLNSNLAALQQIADSADENFLEFRELGDILGRRSPREMAEAEGLTASWLKDDPSHAGAALVRAHALRSMERYDECTRLLDTLDNNFPAMQAIKAAVAAQIAFLAGDIDGAKRDLEKGIASSRGSNAGEPYLIYGWLCMAEQNWREAKTQAVRLRNLAPDDLETAILEGLAVAYDRPTRSRDALQILRRARLNSSPDDWHYHEALAIVHALARDRLSARREMTEALATAPSHIRAELEREQQDIVAGQVPAVDWQARLVRQWLPNK